MPKMFELLGKGATSEVYYINEDLVLKLYHGNISEEDVLQEFNRISYMHKKTDASPYVLDMIKIGDRQGMLLENLGNVTLLDAIKSNPEMAYDYGVKYGELAHSIHKNKADRDLPYVSEALKRGLACSNGEINKEVRDHIEKVISNFPAEKTLLHGDFSPSNIMVKNDRLYIIDPMTLRNGPPVYDFLPCFMFCYCWSELKNIYDSLSEEDRVKNPEWTGFLRNYAERFVDEGITERVFKGFLKGYYGDISDEECSKITAYVRELNYIKYAAAIWNLDFMPLSLRKNISHWASENILKLL